jgi:DNA-binding MarR family transcriptional regulator
MLVMTDTPIALVLGGGSLLSLVGRELNTALERRFATYDVTAQQAALLLHAATGPISPNRLAVALGTDTAGTTRLLDRLVAKGLVQRTRHPEDRRSILVEVTAAGRAVLPHLPPVFGQVTRVLLAGFSAGEIEQLSGMLRRMLTNLETAC